MAGCKYHFCDKCPYRSDTATAISCPADFNPYDTDNCQRHIKFMELEKRARLGKEKKSKFR
jgi:hypothetical protein